MSRDHDSSNDSLLDHSELYYADDEFDEDELDDNIGNRIEPEAVEAKDTDEPDSHSRTILTPSGLAYADLSPEVILQAIESLGLVLDGRVMALNSYENRVYQVGIDQQQPVIVKFYRPARWSNEQILEEHQLSFELAENDLPVVAPLRFSEQASTEGLTVLADSLFEYQGYRFSVFERRGGRAAELDNLDNLFTLGRYLGRMHAVGANKPFIERPSISVETYGVQSVEFLLQHFIPQDLRPAYESLSRDILDLLQQIYAQAPSYENIRVHGDCHVGNILWREDSPHFVDFDDARNAPAIQDLWMLLSGDRMQQELQLAEVLEGYEEFRDFNRHELVLSEALRTLRIINYAAWLARRWSDPAFPLAFPWFNSTRYWSEHILELREQFAALQETPIGMQLG